MIHCQTVTLPLFDAGYHGHFDLRASGMQCRHLSDDALLVHIKAIHAQSRGGYGWPRVWKALLACGIRVANHRLVDVVQPHSAALDDGLCQPDAVRGKLAHGSGYASQFMISVKGYGIQGQGQNFYF